MPVFFFISGFVFYKADRIWNRGTIKQVLKKKFMVQIIPMVVFMTLYLVIFGYLDPKSLGSDKKGYWYMYVLFEFFVLYIFAEALLNKEKTCKGEIYVFIFVLMTSLAAFYYMKYYILYANELGNWKTVFGLLSFVKIRHFIFFWFGAIVRKHFTKFISITDNLSFIAIVLCYFIVLIVYPKLFHIEGIEYPTFMFSGFASVILLFTFFRKKEQLFSSKNWFGKSLQFIGRRTLDIYLIHYFFLPYDSLQDFGSRLINYNCKLLEVVVILPLSLYIIAISLAASRIIRLSPFLKKYLLGETKQ